MSEMNKCTEENGHLQERIRELESALNRLKKDLESKDVEMRVDRKSKAKITRECCE